MVHFGPLAVRVVNPRSFFMYKGWPAMGNIPQQPQTLKTMLWRRRARRIALPVDTELTLNDLTIPAVIRDVSFSDEPDSPNFGVGLFHNLPLPLEETLKCRTNSRTDVLPAQSTVVLMWTRNFGSDGYLSGGRMEQCVPESDDDIKPSANETHEYETTEQTVM